MAAIRDDAARSFSEFCAFSAAIGQQWMRGTAVGAVVAVNLSVDSVLSVRPQVNSGLWAGSYYSVIDIDYTFGLKKGSEELPVFL